MVETLKDKLAKIQQEDDLVLKVFKERVEADSNIYLSDFFLLGVAKRTLALSEGFRTLIAERNFTWLLHCCECRSTPPSDCSL